VFDIYASDLGRALHSFKKESGTAQLTSDGSCTKCRPSYAKAATKFSFEKTVLWVVYLLLVLKRSHQSEQYARAQMEVVASQEIGYLEKNINFLGTLSAVAPLLGLLGTVIGIIESFLMIDVGTNSDPVLMMPGISKALITTAAGMLIAIPALFAHRYFQRLVQEYVAELEQQATLFHANLFYLNASDDVEERIKKAS
jgi:Biopolymer transport proteins